MCGRIETSHPNFVHVDNFHERHYQSSVDDTDLSCKTVAVIVLIDTTNCRCKPVPIMAGTINRPGSK